MLRFLTTILAVYINYQALDLKTYHID